MTEDREKFLYESISTKKVDALKMAIDSLSFDLKEKQHVFSIEQRSNLIIERAKVFLEFLK